MNEIGRVRRRFLWLTLLFVAVIGGQAGGIAGRSASAFPDRVTPEEAFALASRGGALIVDVRTPAEWRESGVPMGAALADFRGAPSPAAFAEAVLQAVGGDRNRPIITICRTSNRSQAARAVLLQQGFGSVAFVTEGVVETPAGPGWSKRGLPVEACRRC